MQRWEEGWLENRWVAWEAMKSGASGGGHCSQGWEVRHMASELRLEAGGERSHSQ